MLPRIANGVFGPISTDHPGRSTTSSRPPTSARIRPAAISPSPPSTEIHAKAGPVDPVADPRPRAIPIRARGPARIRYSKEPPRSGITLTSATALAVDPVAGRHRTAEGDPRQQHLVQLTHVVGLQAERPRRRTLGAQLQGGDVRDPGAQDVDLERVRRSRLEGTQVSRLPHRLLHGRTDQGAGELGRLAAAGGEA